MRDVTDHQLALFGHDQLVAVARGRSVLVVRFTDLVALGHDSSSISLKPVAEAQAKHSISHIAGRGVRRPLDVIAADTDGSVWIYNFEHKGSRRSYVDVAKRPAARLIAKGVEGEIKAIIPTRKKIFVHAKDSGTAVSILYELDEKSTCVDRIAEFSPGHLVSLAPLDRRRTDVLVAVSSQGETRLIGPASGTSTADVSFLDIPRVSAATLLSNRYLVVAQKGGRITKRDVAVATATAITPQSDPWARACKILCELLRRCGCGKPCDCPPPPDTPVPGSETPPGGIVDDEPCDDRHRANLQWTPQTLTMAGTYLVAFSAGNQRMAVFDQQLNLLFERYLGRTGTIVAMGETGTDRMLVFQPHKQQLEAWSLGKYVATLPGLLPDDLTFPPFQPATSVIYYGQRRFNAAPNPHLNVCVFTVVEPGQVFTDPNQNKLLAQIEPNVFDIVNDYYDENSFGDLDVQFSVFGADFGGARTPLVLPQPVADYFYDDFTPGGVEAVMPADWTDPVVLDGTESLQLHTNPRIGDGKDYDVPFAAIWTSKTHASYPVDVDFDGSETLELTVEDQEGNTHVLNLTFGALTLSHGQGEDENAFLASLGSHVTNAIRSAESALPGSPVTVQDVTFRRIRTNDDDSQFGRLQGQYRVAPPADPADATQKGTIAITSVPAPAPAGIDALGLSGAGSRDGVLGSRIQTNDFLRQCLDAAQKDAGEGPGLNDPHFNSFVTSTEDAAALKLTVRITLTNAKGGQGANIAVTGHSGLAGTGWTAATPVPGSESNSNNQNTLRHSIQLTDDVFTAALEHIRATTAWNADAVRAMFEDFDVMMIGFVGRPPAAIPPADQWGADDPNDFARLRMFRRTHIATDQNPPGGETPVSMNTSVVIGQKFNTFQPGVMAHELGHALGLPDLYFASGFRDDVFYIDSWAMMGGGNSNFNHFCGWSKWAVGWIAEDADEDLNRVVDVPLPDPSGTAATEAWLVPVEYWDGNMKNDVRAEVGGTLPISQLMKIHLGSDGGVINFLELRAPGAAYSQNLPPSPAVIATNVLDPDSDRRWAVNGLYRRSVHRLNQGNELRNIGDKWNFAAAVEFPLKGCTAEIVETTTIRGGTIPVYRVKVEREAADYIDLFFQDHVPSWRSPDIWVDWPGDNPDPDVPRSYPVGTPTDQGETVRFPSSGIEKHYLVARVHNAGTVHAEDVKVRWFVCDPPGSGDDGRWVEKDTQTIPVVDASDFDTMPFTWNVDSTTNSHQCLRAEIIDWTIPAEVDPATGDTLHLASDDVKLQNNNAQQNVFDFEALAGSPYDPVEFAFQVHNDNIETETAVLVPDGLPWGATLEVSPAEARIASGKSQIFQCRLTLDDQIIRPGCDNDQGFLLTAWRRAEDSDEKWGSCFYFIRPRYKTEIVIKSGYWIHTRVSAYGQLTIATDEPVDLSGHPPLYVRVRIEVQLTGGGAKNLWRTLPVNSIGQFTLDTQEDVFAKGSLVVLQAWFDRTSLLGSSVSEPLELKQPVIL